MDVHWLRSSSFIYLSVRVALLLQYQKVNFEWFLHGYYYRNGRHQFLLKTLYFSKRLYCRNTIQKILYTHTLFIRYSCYTGQYPVAINNATSSQFFSWTVCLSFLVTSITAVYDLLCFHRLWDYLMTWCLS